MTTLTQDARRTVGMFSTGIFITDHKPRLAWAKSSKSEKLVLQVTDMPVFRSGTFRDSMGYQHTWEELHINQMVANHDHLKSEGIFADVPVRKGHVSFFGDAMDSLVGWHTGLKAETRTSTHDGLEYTYLLASYEIFDEAAAKHVEDGDWRNRSSEVGFYLSNAEAEFWPVYQGFAYVDIPAVEGLNGFSKAVKNRSNFSMMIEQEISMTDEEQAAADKAAADKAAADKAAETQAPAAAAAPAAETPTAAAPAAAAPAAETPAAAAAPAAAAEPVSSDHGRSAHSFSVNGQSTSDFAAVQSHIDMLETANVERETATRGEFVNSLASDGKIPATQVEALTAHAQGLAPEQYASWSASYDSLPSSALFSNYGVGNGEQQPGGSENGSTTEIKRLEGIIAMHSRTMSSDAVKSTKSYKRLAELRGTDA